MIEKIQSAQVEIGKLSRQYGITTDEVQKLQKASSRLGLEFGDIAPILERIQKARAKAAQGGDIGEHLADNFNKLGVSDKDIVSAKSAVDILKEIGSSASKNGSSLDVQNAQFELLGKHATVIKNIAQKLATLGPIKLFSEDNIHEAEDAERRLKEASSKWGRSFSGANEVWNEMKIGAFNQMAKNASYGERKNLGPWNINSMLMTSVGQIIGGLTGAYEGAVRGPTSLAGGSAWDDALKQSAKNKSDRQKALDKMRSGNEMYWNSFKEVEQTTAISGIASRGGQGSLANVGGYFFGDQANQSLLSESKRTTYLLEEIKNKTEKIADNFTLDAP
ncbi:MAG: hypothetical protein WCL08_11275 [Verrucomicrobiota bacterium]